MKKNKNVNDITFFTTQKKENIKKKKLNDNIFKTRHKTLTKR